MIGLSFPTLEELPYVLISLHNRIIPSQAARPSTQGDDAWNPSESRGDDHRPDPRPLTRIITMSNPRRLTRISLSSPWARVLCTSAAAVLCVAVSSAWLGRASAQQPPNAAGQVVPTTPGSPTPDAQAKEKAEEPPTPAELVIDAAKAKIAELAIVRGRDRRAGRDAQSAPPDDQGPLPQGARLSRLFPAHPLGTPRDHRHHAPGLRWRDPLGLPGHHGVADLPQVQHQARDGTTQLARDRPEDEGAVQGFDGIRRPRRPADRPAAHPSGSSRRRKTGNSATSPCGSSAGPGRAVRG